MPIRSLEDLTIDEGTRVLIRVDFNVPLAGDEEKRVVDDTRIRAALPTIEYCLNKNARVILASHLGRPKGTPNPALSLEPVAAHLAELLSREVTLTDEPVGDGARKLGLELREGHVLLLENLRFDPGETNNDDNFAQALGSYCDVYINDAFGAAHRSHASTVGVPSFVAEHGGGYLLQSEVKALGRLLDGPDVPYIAVLGGAKVSDKISVLDSLLQRVNTLIIGGAMANTFLVSQGRSMGSSLVESDKLEVARSFLRKAADRGVKIVLPLDVVVATSMSSEESVIRGVGELLENESAFDIGPQSQAKFSALIAECRTLFWNGPMGVFEKPNFAGGTVALAKSAGANQKAFTVVGGGDSVAAVHQARQQDAFSHISTGGGASLEFIQGKILPGIEATSE